MKRTMRDKLEDGNGTLLISFFILLFSLIISILCIEIGNMLTNKSKTQVWADAAANTIAASAATQNGFDSNQARIMHDKMKGYMKTYGKLDNSVIEMDVDNHYITTRVTYEAPVIYGFTKNNNHSSNNLKATATVEFVDSMNGWVNPLYSFPRDTTQSIHPSIVLNDRIMLNGTETYFAFLKQFYVEDRTRYNYSGTKPTSYGSEMNAADLMLMDVLNTCGLSLSDFSQFNANLNMTCALGTSEYFTDGRIFLVRYNGAFGIAYGSFGDMIKIMYCDPSSREHGMMTIPSSSIETIYRSNKILFYPDSERQAIQDYAGHLSHYD